MWRNHTKTERLTTSVIERTLHHVVFFRFDYRKQRIVMRDYS
ncbi:hypothetical protein [Gracilibacillus xinjiangensis]|uniref:Uncharacterized protein n=1 Tax=Gracilibacillus xinjiangensis TaxID=1193282 RepID=A0ABV8WUM8_9BACI